MKNDNTQANAPGNGKINLDEIARQDGFPKFLWQLEGFGNFVAYSNGEKVRIYDPITGEMRS